MRLAVVVPSVSRIGGGVMEAVRRQVSALKLEDDIQIEVFTLADEFFDADIADWPDVKIIGFKFYGPKNFGFSPGLLRALLSCEADLIHVHGLWMFHCLAVWLCHLLKGLPYIATPHGMLEGWILKRSPYLKAVVSALYQDGFMKRAAAIQILSNRERDDVRRFAHVPIYIVPNYASLPANFSERKSPPWWSEAFVGKKIFLFISRIHAKKGWLELCHAWEIICSSSEEFKNSNRMVFCGWGEDAQKLCERIDVLNSSLQNIIYAGPVYGSDKWATLNAATFVVLPSKSEGVPMVILEAWSVSRPTLISAECNLSIGIERGAAIEIGNSVETIAKGLREASELSSATYSQMADCATTLMNERFTMRAARERLIEMYSMLLRARTN
jgi:glycosyltransferase involved in cell wall biosynthesis